MWTHSFVPCELTYSSSPGIGTRVRKGAWGLARSIGIEQGCTRQIVWDPNILFHSYTTMHGNSQFRMTTGIPKIVSFLVDMNLLVAILKIIMTSTASSCHVKHAHIRRLSLAYCVAPHIPPSLLRRCTQRHASISLCRIYCYAQCRSRTCLSSALATQEKFRVTELYFLARHSKVHKALFQGTILMPHLALQMCMICISSLYTGILDGPQHGFCKTIHLMLYDHRPSCMKHLSVLGPVAGMLLQVLMLSYCQSCFKL